ncbi:MAG: N-6 DNA methylase, partial [Chitinophagaceae bacterium]
EAAFIVHSYLSVFAKMMAYSVVRPEDDFIDDKEMLGILDGSIFNDHNIRNFVDNDFFHWVKSDRNFGQLKKAFRIIAQEISTFDFEDVAEDILKGVYQELIDMDTRHALGEYYTPDWLCERVVAEYDFALSSKILDPSCGSGSFLRAAVHRLKALHPKITIEQLCNAVYGIDIHPLSVQIAKTTMLIALGKGIRHEKKPIHINIILANTLLAPEGVGTLYGSDFTMTIDRRKLKVHTSVLNEVQLFDEALEVADHLAEATMNGPKETFLGFEKTLRSQYRKPGLDTAMVESFYNIYSSLREVKKDGRDSIWKFIVQNLYKPYFLAAKFDFIIGNPPWFTYSSIKNEEYQDTLNQIATAYKVKPTRVANFPHLEIAAIFLAYCSSYFLKAGGRLAFVLPRSFFSADHHENTRNGTAQGFRLTSIWDLDGVTPLFNVPSCVLFAEKAENRREILGTGLAGKTFSGRLPAHNATLVEVAPKLSEEDTQWYVNRQGKASAFSAKKKKAQTKINAYKSEFKQGATIVPRTFYFVELIDTVPEDWEDRVLSLRTAEAVKPDAKAPWKSLALEGRMESKYVFRTALSRSILPYTLYQPDLVVLPIKIETDAHGFRKIEMQTPTEIRREGGLYASEWFRKAELLWDAHKTEKNAKISSREYLNWQNKLAAQKLDAPFLVLYNASAKDANATVIRRADLDLEFIVESKGYAFTTDNLNEATYLSAILNSAIPNEAMKDFQSRGLFGARDVHKKILDVYFPRYDATNSIHQQLAMLSEKAHEKAAQFVADNPPTQALSAIFLGRLRSAIKKHLSKEREAMDKLVKKIVG